MSKMGNSSKNVVIRKPNSRQNSTMNVAKAVTRGDSNRNISHALLG